LSALKDAIKDEKHWNNVLFYVYER
jgi:hypothetical protein